MCLAMKLNNSIQSMYQKKKKQDMLNLLLITEDQNKLVLIKDFNKLVNNT